MQLKEYFDALPYGSKKVLADKVGITQTWIALLISNSRKASVVLAKKIEVATNGAVTAKELRPDIFGSN